MPSHFTSIAAPPLDRGEPLRSEQTLHQERCEEIPSPDLEDPRPLIDLLTLASCPNLSDLRIVQGRLYVKNRGIFSHFWSLREFLYGPLYPFAMQQRAFIALIDKTCRTFEHYWECYKNPSRRNAPSLSLLHKYITQGILVQPHYEEEYFALYVLARRVLLELEQQLKAYYQQPERSQARAILPDLDLHDERWHQALLEKARGWIGFGEAQRTILTQRLFSSCALQVASTPSEQPSFEQESQFEQGLEMLLLEVRERYSQGKNAQRAFYCDRLKPFLDLLLFASSQLTSFDFLSLLFLKIEGTIAEEKKTPPAEEQLTKRTVAYVFHAIACLKEERMSEWLQRSSSWHQLRLKKLRESSSCFEIELTQGELEELGGSEYRRIFEEECDRIFYLDAYGPLWMRSARVAASIDRSFDLLCVAHPARFDLLYDCTLSPWPQSDLFGSYFSIVSFARFGHFYLTQDLIPFYVSQGNLSAVRRASEEYFEQLTRVGFFLAEAVQKKKLPLARDPSLWGIGVKTKDVACLVPPGEKDEANVFELDRFIWSFCSDAQNYLALIQKPLPVKEVHGSITLSQLLEVRSNEAVEGGFKTLIAQALERGLSFQALHASAIRYDLQEQTLLSLLQVERHTNWTKKQLAAWYQKSYPGLFLADWNLALNLLEASTKSD